MDLNEIRQFIDAEGGKFIIVENGKPVMVIVSFEDYKKRIRGNNPAKVREEGSLPEELSGEELKIEDLPF